METARNIAAAIVGIIIIIAIILLARFVGDKIRERLIKPKPQVTTTTTVPTPTESTPSSQVTPTATYSAIPSTGPNDWLYVVFAASALAGLGVLAIANKNSLLKTR